MVSYPRKHCVVRNYRRASFGTFYGRRTIDRLITDDKMSWGRFAEMFETSPHGIVHTQVGGPGGDLSDMASPNDPLFWIHHSMVDYVWMERQIITGKQTAFGGMHRGRKATSKDILKPFKITVEDTFNYESLCYTYQPYSGWAQAAPAALSAGANVVDPADDHDLPDPLPDSWIEMHGWSREKVQEIEAALRELEEKPLVKGESNAKNVYNAASASTSVNPWLWALTVAASVAALIF